MGRQHIAVIYFFQRLSKFWSAKEPHLRDENTCSSLQELLSDQGRTVFLCDMLGYACCLFEINDKVIFNFCHINY